MHCRVLIVVLSRNLAIRVNAARNGPLSGLRARSRRVKSHDVLASWFVCSGLRRDREHDEGDQHRRQGKNPHKSPPCFWESDEHSVLQSTTAVNRDRGPIGDRSLKMPLLGTRWPLSGWCGVAQTVSYYTPNRCSSPNENRTVLRDFNDSSIGYGPVPCSRSLSVQPERRCLKVALEVLAHLQPMVHPPRAAGRRWSSLRRCALNRRQRVILLRVEPFQLQPGKPASLLSRMNEREDNGLAPVAIHRLCRRELAAFGFFE